MVAVREVLGVGFFLRLKRERRSKTLRKQFRQSTLGMLGKGRSAGAGGRPDDGNGGKEAHGGAGGGDRLPCKVWNLAA